MQNRSSTINNLSFVAKQLLMSSSVATIIFVVLLYISQVQQNHLVGGRDYKAVISHCDLIADILPPPAFVIESYLVVHELADIEDTVEREKLIARYITLRDEYTARLTHWRATLQAGALKESLERSAAPAEKLFGYIETSFLPLSSRRANLSKRAK